MRRAKYIWNLTCCANRMLEQTENPVCLSVISYPYFDSDRTLVLMFYLNIAYPIEQNGSVPSRVIMWVLLVHHEIRYVQHDSYMNNWAKLRHHSSSKWKKSKKFLHTLFLLLQIKVLNRSLICSTKALSAYSNTAHNIWDFDFIDFFDLSFLTWDFLSFCLPSHKHINGNDLHRALEVDLI